MSGIVGVVSGMGLLLLIIQALRCVGDVWARQWLSQQNARFFSVVVHNLRAVHLLDQNTT